MALGYSWEKIAESGGYYCSGGYFYVRLYAKLNSQDTIRNTSNVSYKCVGYYTGGGYFYDAQSWGSIQGSGSSVVTGGGPAWYNGENSACETSATVSHASDGTASISGSAIVDLPNYGYRYINAAGSIALPALDRSSPSVSLSVGSPGTNSVAISASANVNCDVWDYSVDGGSSWTTFSNANTTSVSTTISGLALNTSYSVRVRARKTSNNVYGYSSTQSIKTLGYSSIDSASNVNIGSAAAIRWTPLDSSFKFKISLSLGTWSYTSGFIAPGSTSQQTWNSYTIPMSVCNQLPAATSGNMRATLTTYLSNGTEIGSTTKDFTVYVPSSVVPSFTYSLSEGTTSGFSRYATTLSTLRAVLSTSGSYGSIVKTATLQINGVTFSGNVNNNAVTLNSTTLMTPGINTPVILTIVDSRGRTATQNATINIYEYFEPQVDIAFDITNTTVVIDVEGLIASVDSRNAKYLTIKKTRVSDAYETTVMARTAISSYTIEQSVTITVSDIGSESYLFKAFLEDSKGTVTDEVTSGVICISRYAGGKGVRLFGEARQEGFEVGNIDYTITDSDYASLATSLASAFSTSVTYWVGQFVTYSGHTYECNTQHSGNWNSSHFTLLS